MEKPANNKLFISALVAFLILISYAIIFRDLYAVPGLVSAVISIKSAYNRKFSKYTLFLSAITSVISFPSPFYLISVLVVIYVFYEYYAGTLIAGMIEIVLIIVSVLYKVIPPFTVPEYILGLVTSLPLTYLTVMNLRAYKGKDFTIVTFRAKGLPKGLPWFIDLNGNVIPTSDPEINIISEGGSWVTCPVKDSNSFYVPTNYKGSVVAGDYVEINFKQTQDSDVLKGYEECTVSFIPLNIPKELEFSVTVNGNKYTGKSRVIVPVFDQPFVKWEVEKVSFGDVIFEPKQKSGTALRGSVVGIEFEPKIVKRALDIKNWDPKVWVGTKLYGYNVVDTVSEGGSSYVLKGEKDNRYYAIKILKPSFSRSQTVALREFTDLFKESNNLVKLSNGNPYLVKVSGIFADVNQIASVLRGDTETYLKYPPAIVTEFMSGGTAKELFVNYFSPSKDWYEIVRIVIKYTAIALEYMHSNGYIHLDVKPQNIFFSDKLNGGLDEVKKVLESGQVTIKLGDLGSAVRVGEKFFQATPAYCSPEQLEHAILGLGAKVNFDIFSLGMTAYYMVTGKESPVSKYLDEAIDLYNGNDVGSALKKVDEAKQVIKLWNIDFPSDLPYELREFIQKSLKSNIDNLSYLLKNL
ncbi:protein kinase domain-containing protein [Stygiolobus caldivivus]|uniref:Protein kinase domain-containing protein n=1 Tax=Stygiolobus caldivivus TaxID=2824673 RepID=A0A8D5U7M1_9CREN|nr:protein kinase [Stygiolobus caldivivus]BCU71066.1 hypothetical protein KN1_23630 [Stygiolobus caldivivus]